MIITSYATLNTGHPTLQKELDVLCNVHGITHRMYNNETIKLLPQYNDYKHILERPATKGMERARNAGYWIWKAMLILDALQYDDDVLYLDASIRFVVNPMYSIPPFQFMYSPNTDYMLEQYCKEDCYQLLGFTDEKYHKTSSIWAAIIAVHKCDKTISMLNEWLSWHKDERVSCDDPGTLPNAPGFVFHTMEQATLTMLYVKYDIPKWHYMVDMWDYTEPVSDAARKVFMDRNEVLRP